MTAARGPAAPDEGAQHDGTSRAAYPHSKTFLAYRRTGDRRIRDELVCAHMPLARSLAWRFTTSTDSREDLVQVAMVGLVKAVERFDPGRGISFRAFMTPTVQGELKRHVRDRSWRVHVPRRVKEHHVRSAAAVAALTQRLGRSPTMSEVATETGLDVDTVIEALDVGSARSPMSLDAPRSTNDERTLAGDVPSDDDGRLDRIVARTSIAPIVAALPDRDRLMLRLRFVDELSQREIGEVLGVSQVHVSRLLKGALVRIREAVDG